MGQGCEHPKGPRSILMVMVRVSVQVVKVQARVRVSGRVRYVRFSTTEVSENRAQERRIPV